MDVRAPVVWLLTTALMASSGVPMVRSGGGPDDSSSLQRFHGLRGVDINVWSGLDYQGALTVGEYETDDRRKTRHGALLDKLRRLDPDVIDRPDPRVRPSFRPRPRLRRPRARLLPGRVVAGPAIRSRG